MIRYLVLALLLFAGPGLAQRAPELVQANQCVDAAFEKRQGAVKLRMTVDDELSLIGTIWADCDASLRRHAGVVASQLGETPDKALNMVKANAAARIRNHVSAVRTDLLRREQNQ